MTIAWYVLLIIVLIAIALGYFFAPSIDALFGAGTVGVPGGY